MSFLLEPDAYSLLKEYNISVPRHGFADNYVKAEKIAEKIGYPVAMKVVSEDIIHKSDFNAVKLNLNNKNEVSNAFNKIMSTAEKYYPRGKHHGVLISEMIQDGIETIIGIGKDPQFGKFIMFGLGGIYVEIFKDVSFRLIPLDIKEAKEMVLEIKGKVLLDGYRGEKPKNVDALVEVIINCSKLAYNNKELDRMDLNPVIVRESDSVVVDARIKLNEKEKLKV